MPWTTRSTAAANRHSLMYGDLAELPPAKPKALPPAAGPPIQRNGSSRKKPNHKRSPPEEARGGRTGSRMGGEKQVRFHSTDGADKVSREDWEYLWRQYQLQSRLLQEALRQRTSELA